MTAGFDRAARGGGRIAALGIALCWAASAGGQAARTRPSDPRPAQASPGFVRPAAAEALAFLRTLPRGWGRRGPKGEVLTWVQPWERRTPEDIRTMRKVHPGYHIRGPRDLAQNRPVAPESRALPRFVGKLHIRLAPEDYRYFTAFEKLEVFEITHDVEEVTDACLFYLGRLGQSMVTIRLEMTDATGEGIKHLQRLKKLRSLSLNFSRTIGDVALVHAAGIPTLERLDVCGCPSITGTGVKDLARLRKLKTLKIGSCSLSDASLDNFKALSVRELDLSHVEKGWIVRYRGGGRARFTVSYAGLRKLLAGRENLPNLRRLILTGTAVTGRQKRQLADLRPGLSVR